MAKSPDEVMFSVLGSIPSQVISTSPRQADQSGGSGTASPGPFGAVTGEAMANANILMLVSVKGCA